MEIQVELLLILKRIKKLENIENLSKGEIEAYKDKIKKQNHKNILEIRQVIQSYGDVGKIYLGGIPMIADDMMTFIKSDIVVFGLRGSSIYYCNVMVCI